MKFNITEDQFEKLNQEDDILDINFKVFNNDWNLLQKFLNRRGNPPYKISSDLDLSNYKIESLGNLESVGGNLDLYNSDIKSLGNLRYVGGDLNLNRSNIESLGNLVSVGEDLHLYKSKMNSLGNLRYVGGDLNLNGSNIESFGNLESVGADLHLRDAPLLKKYTKKEIRQMVDVKEAIII
jgi:hypothetical protein